MSRPACPICGAADAGAPDALGVHRCSACGIEFRPRVRMPVRASAVTYTPKPNTESKATIIAVIVIAMVLGLAVSLGEHKARTTTTIPSVQMIEPPKFEPIDLSNIEFVSPLAPIPLRHELHLSQVSEGRLFATGLVHADEAVEEISVAVTPRDMSGAPLPVQQAVVACRSLGPGQRCAWAIDVPLEGAAAELDFDARGRRALALGLLEIELPAELDPAERRVRLVLDDVLMSPWATVTAFDSRGRVLGVSRTQWGDILGPGEIERELELPRPPDEVARYEVRVGGLHH